MNAFLWESLQFREPWWCMLALQPLLLTLLAGFKYRHQQLSYADPELLPWVMAGTMPHERRYRYVRFLVMQSCWLLIAVAMAGPRYPDPVRTPDREQTADIMVLVDVSRSMTATDIKPDRLKRAKVELFQLLMHNKVDRIGIILFAGQAHVMSPLTWDRKVSRFYVESIQAGLLPTEGSNIQAAISLANAELLTSKNPVILLMSDGDFNLEASPGIESRIPVHILGMGTAAGTSLAAEEGGWLYHDNRPVITRLQQQILKDIASSSGGQYETLTAESAMLNRLFQQTSNSKRSLRSVKAQDQSWVELYPWFLVPALLLLLFMSVHWIRLQQHQVSSALALLLVPVLFLLPVEHSEARAWDTQAEQQAYAAYTKKDFQTAMDIYATYAGYRPRMGEGASAFQIKDYKRAITQFTQAFLVADRDGQRADALYNLANSFFFNKDYQHARDVYADVLKYQPHDRAQANLAFVEALLASLQDDPFANQTRARRAGRGPRSQLADENTRGGGDFSLDDKEMKKTLDASRSVDTASSLSDQIASGKGRVQVADEGIQNEQGSKVGSVSVADLLAARKLVLQEKQNQVQLWKSLFEEGEGFPAPVEKPLSRPGVLPW